MHHVKKWMREFFSISHAQANGIMVLLPLVSMILLSEPLWQWYDSRRPRDSSADLATLDSMIVLWNFRGTGLHENATSYPVFEPSSFNPNTAARETLVKLGFSEKLSSRIITYRNKGGQFRVRSDLLKIYGMDTLLYKRLNLFIELPVTAKKDFAISRKAYVPRNGPLWTERKSFDINAADTLQLKEIQGIGSKLSARIIKYRDALGGFVSSSQMAEVFGLDSTVVNRLSKKTFIGHDFVPHKINLNSATEAILGGHPYLSKSEARSIVAYRFQHGEFKSIEDLTKLPTFRENTIRRIKPYLTITDR
ncbi:MAG: helix-hairpin-helix domain-containing protein [Chryseolinea sp.]